MLIAIVSSSGFLAFADGNDNEAFHDKAYPYACIMTVGNSESLPTEAVPPVKFSDLPFAREISDCFFISDINLSGFEKPVLRYWNFSDYSPGYYPDGDFNVLSKDSRYVGLDNPKDGIVALPAIDGLRFGKNVRLSGHELFTIGELPANKDDITISSLSMQIVKGASDGGVIMAETTTDGLYKEAEVRYSAPALSTLDQAYFYINTGFETRYSDDLADGGEQGLFTCSVVTPQGEVNPYCIGENQENTRTYFLLPANSSEIIIRWRFPEHSEGVAHDEYHENKFISEVIQPGYVDVPVLTFSESDLTGDYGDFKSSDPIKIAEKFNALTSFDFNHDGIKEWLGYSTSNGYGLIQFNQSLSSASFVKVGFANALAFSPNNSNTLGYDKSSIFSVDSDFNHKTLYSATDARFALVDFDNDGTVDFIDLNSNSVVNILPDGDCVVSHLNTMSMKDYLGVMPPKDNPLGSGLSVIGDSKCPPAVFASYIRADINGDGYPDFVDATSGNFYMNLGDGRFVTDSFGGKLLFRDFDGDGINDFLLYDSDAKTVSVTLQRIGEEAVTKRLFNGFNCGDDIWIRDFDNDGDVDILIPFQAEDNDGMAFLVMFENNGAGTFKKKEYMIEGKVNFRKCIDWNSDGKYEVLADMHRDNDNYAVPVMKMASYSIDGLTVNTVPEYIITDRQGAMSNCPSFLQLSDVVDFDNSGQPRLVFDRGYMVSPATTLNTRPAKPAAPQISFDKISGELTVTWQRGTDKETPSADLTYELRIGTTPDGDELLHVAATPDGLRLDALRGNCGYDLKRKFNTKAWPTGDIYVSIQSIDDSGLGSQFSEPAVFKNTNLPSQFIVDAPLGVAIYEDISLKPTFTTTGLNLKWSADGAEISSTSESDAKLHFTSPGLKTVILTVSDGKGNSASSSLDIEVFPVRFVESDDPDTKLALDLDCDGLTEVFAGASFYEGDLSGSYKKINRLFNTKYYYNPFAVDINLDGLPDIIHSTGHLINDGDKAMSDMTPDNFTALKLIPDLNNDGLQEIIGSNSLIMKNSGDYVNFIDISDGGLSPSYPDGAPQFFDFNNDGLTDVYYIEPANYGIAATYYENLGAFKFRKHELPHDKDTQSFYYHLVGDFDGNGKADFICYYGNDNSSFVLWDNGERTDLDGMSLSSQVYNPHFDIDNNGCMDIIDPYNRVALLFNADHSFTIVDTKDLPSSGSMPYLRTDGKIGICDNIVLGAPNEKPSVTTGVKASVEGSNLVITWNAATDKETPSANLRYNISVKHLGADGEEAYIISPMNGGLNDVRLPNDCHLVAATRFPVPLLALPKGEYEIKVQAVDGRMTPGDFSAAVTIKIESAGYEAPDETMVGATVAITFNADVNISDVDFGKDAIVERTLNQTAYVLWTSEGTKTVTAPSLQFSILVHTALDASFFLPERVPGGASVYIPAEAEFEHTWKLSGYRPSFGIWEYMGEPNAERIDDHTVAIRFNYASGYSSFRLTHTVTASYGSDTYENETAITSAYQPQIGIVDIDDETGKYCIRSMSLGTDEIDFLVYRETETYNEYELIGTMSGNDTFIDMESSPLQHASRYAVKARFYYGESLMGKPHQPIHAMISKGINGEWNISWSKYEGRDAATYRILRGNSQTSLDCIAEVSGNNTSFSDTNPSASTRYYAVETLIARSTAAMAPALTSRAPDSSYWRSRSNTVSTELSGIEDIVIDDNSPVDIYTVTGICLKRNATKQDIEDLSPGIYIIGGHKTAIR